MLGASSVLRVRRRVGPRRSCFQVRTGEHPNLLLAFEARQAAQHVFYRDRNTCIYVIFIQ